MITSLFFTTNKSPQNNSTRSSAQPLVKLKAYQFGIEAQVTYKWV